MNNILPSKKIYSVREARDLARRRMPRMMFDFVDGASGDEKLCENNSLCLCRTMLIFLFIICFIERQ